MGNFQIEIPKPGLYFINLYVDDSLVGSSLFPAETDKPEISFSLTDEQLERIRNGELIALLKRSINLEDIANYAT